MSSVISDIRWDHPARQQARKPGGIGIELLKAGIFQPNDLCHKGVKAHVAPYKLAELSCLPSSGAVSLIRTRLRKGMRREFHAAIWRHSASAAERFCLKVSRGVR